MKGDFDFGNLVHWARDDLGIALDADFSISVDQAKDLMAQIARGNDDSSFIKLMDAFKDHVHRIFKNRLLDARDVEENENEFWTKIWRKADKYDGRDPVEHWLSVIAKNQARNAFRSQIRRMKHVEFLSEIAAKMPDFGEEDDLDLEMLADEHAIAEERSLTPYKILEQEELAKEARRVMISFLGSLDAETAEAIIRNKVDGITYEAWEKRAGRVGKTV